MNVEIISLDNKEIKVLRRVNTHNGAAIKQEAFIVSDIISLAQNIEEVKEIKFVNGYYMAQEDKASFIHDYAASQDDNAIIAITAHLSTLEFPREEYYDPDNARDIESKGNRKPLPWDSILERESCMLADAGFININHYVDYEYKIAFIYNNAAGRKVAEKITEIMSQELKELQSF
jgi:hypothetical protein